MSRYSAVGLLFASATLWSTGGLLIKSLDWSPFWIAGSRSLVAAAVLFLVYRRFSFTASVAQLGGAIAYALTVVLFVMANKWTTAANAIVLQYTAPLYVAAFGGWFLGEKSTRLDWFTIFLALGGMVLFFLDKLTTQNFWGNVISICSGVSFGWLVLFLRKQKKTSNIESVFLGNVLAVVLCLPFWRWSDIPVTGGWTLLAMGAGQLALPYILYTRAIRNVRALEAMMVPLVEPILNPLWVFLWLGERPGSMAMIGGAIILGTIAFRSLFPYVQGKSS